MTSATTGGKTYTFTYNDEGLRTSKTVNGVTTVYYYSGNTLIAEQSPIQTIIYIYDANGLPIGMQCRLNTYAKDVWDLYWYDKNLQGDIVGVYNSSGTKLITYRYDAWGDPYITYHSGNASSLYAKNPFMYRGYYYDKDLGLYYLQTRYYDPLNRRFISPDAASVITATPTGLTDKNLYAYCDNNPVSRADDGGEFWHLIVGGAVGGIVGAATAALNGGDLVDIIVGASSGIASGVLTASGVGIVGQVAGSAAISMASNAAGQVKNILTDDTGEATFDVVDMVFDGAVSAVAAYWGGNGASHGNTAGINSSWNRLFKKGLFNSNALQYFYKTAHNSSKEFVLTSLAKSTVKNIIGSSLIMLKNQIRGIFGW